MAKKSFVRKTQRTIVGAAKSSAARIQKVAVRAATAAATAAAEAMTMFHRLQTKKAPAGQESIFIVSERCFAQTIDVVRGRAEPLKIKLVIGDLAKPLLGVDPAELKGVKHVFHLGALYDMTASAEANEKANVVGTRNTVELANALKARLRLCVYELPTVRCVLAGYPRSMSAKPFPMPE